MHNTLRERHRLLQRHWPSMPALPRIGRPRLPPGPRSCRCSRGTNRHLQWRLPLLPRSCKCSRGRKQYLPALRRGTFRPVDGGHGNFTGNFRSNGRGTRLVDEGEGGIGACLRGIGRGRDHVDLGCRRIAFSLGHVGRGRGCTLLGIRGRDEGEGCLLSYR